jgi:hypothetical protein
MPRIVGGYAMFISKLINGYQAMNGSKSMSGYRIVVHK